MKNLKIMLLSLLSLLYGSFSFCGINKYDLKWAVETGIIAGAEEMKRRDPGMFNSLGKMITSFMDGARERAMILAQEGREKAFEAVKNAGGSTQDAYKAAQEIEMKIMITEFTSAIGKVGTMIGNAIKEFYTATGFDINGIKRIIAWFTAATVGSYAAKKGFDFLKEYYILRLSTPQLVRSILTPSQITKSLDDLLYTGKTNTQIKRIIKTTKGVVDNKKTSYFYRFNPFRDTSKGRARFENVMLWGPPGTGKTAIVEIIAKEAGMNIFMTSGGDFAKLRGKDLQQIDEIFKTMRSSSRPCILFIDEMEELFGSRTGKSEESRQILTKLLTEFSEPSNQIMLIGATNRPEDIDEAMHRRMPVQIEVAYPNKAGRVKIFTLYKKIFFEKDSMYSKAQLAEINKVLSDQTIKNMTETMGAISPAEIANIMGTIKNRSLTDNKGIPTQAIIDEVLQDKKGQLQAIQQGFKRTDIATIEAAPAT